MKQYILTSIRLTLISIVVLVGFYSMIILGIAQASPNKGRGETLSVNGKIIGYALEGQRFNEDKYFWGRPSAVDYNAAGSAGSNKGPSNPDYLKQVKERLDSFMVHNPGVSLDSVPSEMLTASGSGLDPDISLTAADVQIKRIAVTRNVPEQKISALVKSNLQGPLLGIFGTAKINVLKLNIQLDQLR